MEKLTVSSSANWADGDLKPSVHRVRLKLFRGNSVQQCGWARRSFFLWLVLIRPPLGLRVDRACSCTSSCDFGTGLLPGIRTTSFFSPSQSLLFLPSQTVSSVQFLKAEWDRMHKPRPSNHTPPHPPTFKCTSCTSVQHCLFPKCWDLMKTDKKRTDRKTTPFRFVEVPHG